MSFWDEWYKKFGKRKGMFGEFDDMIREMEKEMAKMMRDMENNLPEYMTRDIRGLDGSTRREYGPFVYGYSVRIGPDGKPVIREFGNMKPGLGSSDSSPLNVQNRREPLVDIIEDRDSLKIVAELPGVEKQDIKLFAKPRGLTISVENESKKFYKELKFEIEVDRFSARSSYKNGVLEVSFNKIRDEEGTEISVE